MHLQRANVDRINFLNGGPSMDRQSHSIDEAQLHDLLTRATRTAIQGAYDSGSDVPVGAATSHAGEILAAEYAQDNLIGDERAHAEFMALQKTYEHHNEIEPDTIGVTLEPCVACQKYICEQPSIKLVAFVLPRNEASSRGIIRPKNSTIVDRGEQEHLPFTIVQFEDEQLARVGQLLLDYTQRDISTQETSVDLYGLHHALPPEFRL